MGSGAQMVKLVGFGSLLSEQSARATFGDAVRNFRLARLRHFRRVFAHPASIFFQRGIAKLDTKEIASLSTEPAHGHSFLISVFDITDELLPQFYEREEEFAIVPVEVEEMDGTSGGQALMCTRWNDEEYIKAKGQQAFDQLYRQYGIESIWGWDEHSGILPCRVYLRHCVLAVQKLGPEVAQDFLTTTFLGDRKTTLQRYLEKDPSIMQEVPPAHLADRYSG